MTSAPKITARDLKITIEVFSGLLYNRIRKIRNQPTTPTNQPTKRGLTRYG